MLLKILVAFSLLEYGFSFDLSTFPRSRNTLQDIIDNMQDLLHKTIHNDHDIEVAEDFATIKKVGEGIKAYAQYIKNERISANADKLLTYVDKIAKKRFPTKLNRRSNIVDSQNPFVKTSRAIIKITYEVAQNLYCQKAFERLTSYVRQKYQRLAQSEFCMIPQIYSYNPDISNVVKVNTYFPHDIGKGNTDLGVFDKLPKLSPFDANININPYNTVEQQFKNSENVYKNYDAGLNTPITMYNQEAPSGVTDNFDTQFPNEQNIDVANFNPVFSVPYDTLYGNDQLPKENMPQVNTDIQDKGNYIIPSYDNLVKHAHNSYVPENIFSNKIKFSLPEESLNIDGEDSELSNLNGLLQYLDGKNPANFNEVPDYKEPFQQASENIHTFDNFDPTSYERESPEREDNPTRPQVQNSTDDNFPIEKQSEEGSEVVLPTEDGILNAKDSTQIINNLPSDIGVTVNTNPNIINTQMSQSIIDALHGKLNHPTINPEENTRDSVDVNEQPSSFLPIEAVSPQNNLLPDGIRTELNKLKKLILYQKCLQENDNDAKNNIQDAIPRSETDFAQVIPDKNLGITPDKVTNNCYYGPIGNSNNDVFESHNFNSERFSNIPEIKDTINESPIAKIQQIPEHINNPFIYPYNRHTMGREENDNYLFKKTKVLTPPVNGPEFVFSDEGGFKLNELHKHPKHYNDIVTEESNNSRINLNKILSQLTKQHNFIYNGAKNSKNSILNPLYNSDNIAAMQNNIIHEMNADEPKIFVNSENDLDPNRVFQNPTNVNDILDIENRNPQMTTNKLVPLNDPEAIFNHNNGFNRINTNVAAFIENHEINSNENPSNSIHKPEVLYEIEEGFNPSKFNKPTNAGDIVELTYIVKRNKPIIYRPTYYVKYKLPYKTFKTYLEDIMKKEPYEQVPERLYQNIVKFSKITDVSQDLKNLKKEDVLKVALENGSLVRAILLPS